MENSQKEQASKSTVLESIVDKIWNLFSSVKLAVVIFTLISVTSIIGTIIQQQADPQQTTQLLSKLFGNAAPTVYAISHKLGFTDMYHSWWFLTLLLLFAANLIICSMERLPKIMKLVKEPIKPLAPHTFDALSLKKEITLKGKLAETAASVEAAFKGIGFNPARAEDENGIQLYSEKGKYSRLGVYVTHFSILLILLGAVQGKFFGFEGYIPLQEGATTSVAHEPQSGKEIPLGFSIFCNDFDVSFYGDSDVPKSYKSWLTVVENGKPVKIGGKEIQEVEVNTPLRYKGVIFYQASYGFRGDALKDALFRFSITTKDGKRGAVEAKFQETFKIPGTNITGQIADFSPALAIDQSNQLITYANTMNNPAVFVVFSEGGKEKYKQWILKRLPQSWSTPDARVELQDVWGVQYTGLQVRKDPGVWLVYIGCLLMAVGLYAAFFMSHRRVWVRLREEKNKTHVAIAASSNKNRIALEQKMEKFVKGLIT